MRRPPPAPPTPCPAATPRPALDAICDRDQAIRTLRARFRSDVDVNGEEKSADGVLVWRAPGALRVKLFTLAGLTVYDALWVGDGERVRGIVRQPLAGRSESFDLGPGETTASPDADLALVLWSLWQPRCTRPPVRQRGTPGSFALDPAPARAIARDVVVNAGEVREEKLVRRGPSGAEEPVIVRYADYACEPRPPLPRHVEIAAPAKGWRAQVTILDEARNVPLDEGLFVVPDAASGRGR